MYISEETIAFFIEFRDPAFFVAGLLYEWVLPEYRAILNFWQLLRKSLSPIRFNFWLAENNLY